jgi:hypothetical protein
MKHRRRTRKDLQGGEGFAALQLESQRILVANLCWKNSSMNTLDSLIDMLDSDRQHYDGKKGKNRLTASSLSKCTVTLLQNDLFVLLKSRLPSSKSHSTY